MDSQRMEAPRIDLKIFAAPGEPPPAAAMIRTFHRWIQTSRLEELMLDVADYSHVYQGPGVLLMCHGSHYALDSGGGDLALLYSRRRSGGKPPVDAEGVFASAFRLALRACLALEEEPELRGYLHFPGDRFYLALNDRRSPYQEDLRRRTEDELRACLERLLPGEEIALEPGAESRLTYEIRSQRAPGVAALLQRLEDLPELAKVASL